MLTVATSLAAVSRALGARCGPCPWAGFWVLLSMTSASTLYLPDSLETFSHSNFGASDPSPLLWSLQCPHRW